MSDKLTRIMVVDGSSVSRAILGRILREELEGVEVTTCESGEEALELLKQQSFDLVTTALLLSDMDGLALSRSIRDTKQHHYTPVIVVSGDADVRLLKEGFEAGVTDYFDKSNGYKAFGNFIKSFIQRNTGLVGNVLYVEDSNTAAAVTRKILEKHGLKVTLTDNAEQAIILLDNPNPGAKFDMVITDFFLEGKLTGGDLLHAIRTRLHLSQQEMPVLVLTGSDDKQKQVEVFHAGGNDFVGKPIIEEVLIARVRSLLLIKHQYDALKQQTEAMRWIAATDSLTGVRSKRYLVDNGESFIRDPSHQPVWAMLLDIDNFKKINDKLGHITGDHVLAEIGETLNEWFPEEMVVRFGGEE
ncbi:MAG: response regulator, partial [Thiohalophilus sp.]